MTHRTPQEIFDIAYRHFVRDNQPRSEADNGDCEYRGANGARCAVGLFIEDKDYNTEMEGKELENMRQLLPDDYFGDDANLRLLAQLQYAHDGAMSASHHTDRIKTVALSNGLTIPIS